MVGKHNHVPDENFNAEELRVGIEIEHEHTDDPEIAKSIAKDHLSEFGDYYTRLVKMEQEAKSINYHINNTQYRQPSTIMKYLKYEHLPPNLVTISKRIHDVAVYMDNSLPASPEKSAGLRKLLEAKDCFVRSALEK